MRIGSEGHVKTAGLSRPKSNTRSRKLPTDDRRRLSINPQTYDSFNQFCRDRGLKIGFAVEQVIADALRDPQKLVEVVTRGERAA